MNRRFPTITAAVVLLATGFVLGRSLIRSAVDLLSPAGKSQETTLRSTDPATKRLDRLAMTRTSSRSNPSRPGKNVEYLKTLIDAIHADPDNLELINEWSHFVKTLGADDIGMVMDQLCRAGYSNKLASFHLRLWQRWAELDPEAALQRANNPGGLSFESDPEYSGWASRVILMNWFDQGDQDAAIRWINQHPDVPSTDAALGIIITIMSMKSPENFEKKAVDLLSSINDEKDRTCGVESLVEVMIQGQGFESSFDWVSGIQDHSLRAQIISSMVDHSSDYADLEHVADWLRENAGENEAPLMSTTMQSMCDRDIQSAVTYFERIEDQEMKKNALVGMIYSEALAKQPDAFIPIMDSHASLMTDDLVEHFVHSAYQTDKSLAIKSIGRIQNPQQREQAYRKYMLSWLTEDYDAAIEWGRQSRTPECYEGVLRELINLQQP